MATARGAQGRLLLLALAGALALAVPPRGARADSDSVLGSGPPGFTRSVVRPDYALIAAESFVFGGAQGWACSAGCECSSAVLISPAMTGARFGMQILRARRAEGAGAPPCVLHGPGAGAHADAQRLVYVLGAGELTLETEDGGSVPLAEDAFAYFRPGSGARLLLGAGGAELLAYDSLYTAPGAECGAAAAPEDRHGRADDRPLVPVDGEVFKLRKLLPGDAAYDFNIHVMDFEPGEYLNVKEVHYNHHGLWMREGLGVYRLADDWYPVAAGDAIYMAPFVPQWYGALGYSRTRYILYKDTNRDPLLVA